jgi:hypothetical protein
MLIQNYGLFWEGTQVLWQGAGPAGAAALWGWGPRRNSNRGIVNFREQTGVYVLYANYVPIYVGQAGSGNADLFDRLRHHWNVDMRGRWDRFSWFGTRWVTNSGRLSELPKKNFKTDLIEMHDHLEALLLAAMEPPLNRQGGKWGSASRYSQERDPRLGLTQEAMLRKLMRHESLVWKEGLEPRWQKLL